MKVKLFIALALSAFALQAQQSFSGLRNSPYGGVYNLTSNPASLVGGMKKWHVNLLSMDIDFSNNSIELTPNLVKSFEKYTKIEGNPLVSYNDINVDINTDVLGPSFFFHIGEKNALAVYSRARMVGDIRKIDAKIMETYLSSKVDLLNYPEIRIDDQNVSVNAMTEIGASYSRLLFSIDNHSLKAGITAKYVMGAASSYAGFSNFSGKAEIVESGKDKVLKVQGTGDFIVTSGGVDFVGKFNSSDLTKPTTSALGFDLGLVYEYRSEPCPSCVRTPYDFKIGVSVTDIGSLKYTSSGNSYRYKINTGTTPLNFNLDNIQESLDKASSSIIVKEEISGQKMVSSLPTALRFYADAAIWSNLYLDFEGQINMVGKSELYAASYSNAFVVTPRLEYTGFGLYVPIAHTTNVGTSVGTALRLGPLVVGSNTILSNVLFKNAKALNVFFGLQFGK